MYGIQGVFYRVNILNIFHKKTRVPETYISKLNAKTEFTNLKVAYFNRVISHILKLNNLSKIADWILAHQNEDGGFGPGRSDILSTHNALESLNYINPSLIEMKNHIIDFTQNCLTKEGGFTFIPDIYPPFLEPTYAGIRIHEILDIEPINLNKTVEWVQNLHNNGGFRRSKYGGISELEYTFKALYIIINM